MRKPLPKHYRHRKKKPVKILKNGNVLVFDTVRDAATALGVSPTTINGARWRGAALRCGAVVVTDSKIYA
jgi:hypothetical protein